jgi:hypothetical protein
MGRAPRALAIAVSVLAVSLASCTSQPNPRTLAIPASSFVALWPETTLDAALRAQGVADAGDLGWRLDPGATARRFASRVLGWDGSLIVNRQTWSLDSGIQIARVWLCETGGCPPSGAAFDQEVILKRLARSGSSGVWSVTDVTSGRILLDDGPRIRIRDPHLLAGRRLGASTRELADGTKLVAGSAAFGPCGIAVDQATATVRFSTIRFQVGTALDAPCSKVTRPPGPTPGYVFVISRDRGTAADPSTLFTRPRPDGSPPIPDLTAIAVRFLPRSRIPRPPARWWSRDPATLPTCGDEQLRLGPISAGGALAPDAVGIGVQLSRRNVTACHVRTTLRLDLSDRTGEPISVPGRHRISVDGFLPGYRTGSRVLNAGWMLSDWCGHRVDGPVIIRITGAGKSVVARSAELAMWCPPQMGVSTGPSLRPMPG